MKMTKEQTILGLEDLQTAVVSACASRNRHARVAGFSPIQLVFGKDTSIRTNLMDAMAGQFQFQLARPEEAFHRAAQMRRAASDAFQWMEATDALKRVAGSRARLPKLELLTEGAQVMFWEPPAHRKGLSRRHGAIKRVWVRYRNKLKGMPLEFVRMTVAEEQEAAQIAKAALEELEEQIRTGRANAEKVSSSSSSSSSTSSDEEKNDKNLQKKKGKKPTSSSQDAPIEEQQVWELAMKSWRPLTRYRSSRSDNPHHAWTISLWHCAERMPLACPALRDHKRRHAQKKELNQEKSSTSTLCGEAGYV
jgi:hypothetical protein